MIKDASLSRSKGILNTRILRSKIGSHTLRYIVTNFWFRLSLLFVLLSFTVRSFLWQPFAIPSQSMLPTIWAGDYVFADKSAYGYNRYTMPYEVDWFAGSMQENKIKRGDIIVFRGKDGADYIKRIIGMPSDRLQMVEGKLHINGLAVKKERVTDLIIPESENSPCFNPQETRVKAPNQPAVCHYRQYRETVADNINYLTLDLSDTAAYDTSKLVLVPPRFYYVMGDNRDQSLDSRISLEDGGIGLVEMGYIIGKVETVFFSVDGSGDLLKFWQWSDAIRGDRLIKSANE